MPVFACRLIAGFAMWCSLISPAVAQYPWSNRDITENVIYNSGRHVFVDSDAADSRNETSDNPVIATNNPELSPFLAWDRNAADVMSTTGSAYRLSDGE